MSQTERHDHDLGFAHDLRLIERQLLARRKALGWLASAGGAAVLAGCGGGGGGAATGTSVASTGTTGAAATTGTTTTTTTTTATTGTATSSSSGCVADPTETQGPFPADGTNTSSGATSNVLTSAGILRSDIRSSFVSSTTVTTGVPLTLNLTLVNTASSCAVLSGLAIYVWHCSKDGQYSLYDVPAESWLRGMQISDASGKVSFTTIFPGCYSGRYPHIHFEVFASQAAATSGRASLLTSQLAMEAAASSAVYNSGLGYTSSASNFSRVSTSSDGVFGDNSAAQIAAMTPSFTGSPTAGYVANAMIGLAR